MSERYDVIVIGGGAAGLMAAGRAAERGKRVLLLEKNPQLGVKLSITGGGRCNVTNAELDVRALLKHYENAEHFLYAPFSQFGVPETFSFFEKRGLRLVVEDRNRAFPHTHRAADVVRVLRDYLQSGGVVVHTREPVTEILREKNRISGVRTKAQVYEGKHYILATGGVSHQETGSTGDGFEWLRTLGHTVHEPTPTIVPLKVKEHWVKDLAGKTLPQVKVALYSGDTKVCVVKGDVLCTHFGVSGPTILNLASRVADALHTGETTLRVDLFPHEELGTLNARLVAHLQMHQNKTLKNALKDFLPSGTSDVLLGVVSQIDPETKAHSFSKELRGFLLREMKALTITVTGLMGFERAVIADGGVPLTEIEMNTFRSKRVQNLSIVGDVLHINRPSGGYSLQLCWTSGWVAGNTF